MVNQVKSGNDLLEWFSIYQAKDPTNGCVNYQYETEIPNSLCKIENDLLYISTAGANYPQSAQNIPIPTDPNENIPSIRIYTQETLQPGIFSFYIKHLPAGNGVWPAVWLSQDGQQILQDGSYGQWPQNGELDIIEQVNDNSYTNTTLHIGPYLISDQCANNYGFCETSSISYFPTKKKPSDPKIALGCQPNFEGTKTIGFNENCSVCGDNAGCGLQGPLHSFGSAFNSHYPNGAVYTIDWKATSDCNYTISCYFLTDVHIIENDEFGPFAENPDISKWQVSAYAKFNTTQTNQCVFRNPQLIINITLCGDWAGNTFENQGQKGIEACNSYVHHQENNLKEAYFAIKAIAYSPYPLTNAKNLL